MMNDIRTIIVGLVAAVAFAISLIGASMASAQEVVSDAGVVVFHGSTTVSGTIPGGFPPATGGSGSFTFAGGADACAILSLPETSELLAPPPGDPIGSCSTISGTGTYQSIVCGTGTASGHATVKVDDDDGVINADFSAATVAGVSVMVATNPTTTDGDAGGVGIGILVASDINHPGQPDECTGDTTAFDLEGMVAITVLEGGN
jgi:hypothetical protein